MPIEQNVMEAQLREERLLNAAILAASSDLILICDHKGRIVRFNQQLTRYGCKKLKGTYIWDSVLAPQDIKRAKEFFNRVKSSNDSLVVKESI